MTEHWHLRNWLKVPIWASVLTTKRMNDLRKMEICTPQVPKKEWHMDVSANPIKHRMWGIEWHKCPSGTSCLLQLQKANSILISLAYKRDRRRLLLQEPGEIWAGEAERHGVCHVSQTAYCDTIGGSLTFGLDSVGEVLSESCPVCCGEQPSRCSEVIMQYALSLSSFQPFDGTVWKQDTEIKGVKN